MCNRIIWRGSTQIHKMARLDSVTSGLKRIFTAFLGLMALTTLYSQTLAKPLQSETCVKLAGEHIELRKAGIEEAMDQDPTKAGEVLKPEQLAQIERYLFIEGQIRFRCPEIRLPGIKDPDLKNAKKDGKEKAKKKTKKKPQESLAPQPDSNAFSQLEDRG